MLALLDYRAGWNVEEFILCILSFSTSAWQPLGEAGPSGCPKGGEFCACAANFPQRPTHTSGVLPGLSIGQESLLHSSYVVYSTLHVFSCLFYMCFFTLKYISGLLGI